MAPTRAAILECGANHAAFGLVESGSAGPALVEHAFESFPLAPDRLDPAPPALGEALAALRARVAHRGPVTLVLPASLLLVKPIAVPPVAGAARERVIAFEATRAIPYPLAEVVWDYFAPPGAAASEVLVFAAKLVAVERLCAAVEAAGFAVAAVGPGPLVTLAAGRPALPAVGGILLGLGPRTTEVWGVAAPQARLRLLAFGWADFPDAASWAEQLAEELARTNAHLGVAGPTAGAWLVARTDLPTGIREALAARLRAPVELVPSKPDPLALVPALTGTGGIPGADLLPPLRRRELTWRRRLPWLAVAAGLALASLAPPLVRYRAEAAEARRQARELEAELVPVRARVAQHRGQLERLADLRQRIETLRDVEERRHRWVGFLADLQDRLGQVEDVWLDRLEIAPGSGEPGATGPLRLAITGRMLDQANPLARVSPETYGRVKALFARMAESPFVAEVQGERFDSEQPGLLRFEVVLVASERAPL